MGNAWGALSTTWVFCSLEDIFMYWGLGSRNTIQVQQNQIGFLLKACLYSWQTEKPFTEGRNKKISS